MAYVKINGTSLPVMSKEGLTIDRESIWSENTTRDSSGVMQGTLIAYKWKLKLKWNVLTQSEASTIASLCSPSGGWVTCTFTDNCGTNHTINAYCSAVSSTMYSWVNGKKYLKDVSVDIIER